MDLFTSKNDYLGIYMKDKVGFGWLRVIPSGNTQVVESQV